MGWFREEERENVVEHLVREGHLARMGPDAWAVYAVLLVEADPDGTVHLSQDTLERLTGLPPFAVTKALERLEALGYLEARPPGGWRVRPEDRFLEECRRAQRIVKRYLDDLEREERFPW